MFFFFPVRFYVIPLSFKLMPQNGHFCFQKCQESDGLFEAVSSEALKCLLYFVMDGNLSKMYPTFFW